MHEYLKKYPLLEKPVFNPKKDIRYNVAVIYASLSGSRAYNMHTETSDTEYQGIAVPSREYFLTNSYKFEQIRDKTFDNGTLSIYSIQKAFHLLMNCNPNVIEMLFTPPEQHIVETEYSKLLLENRHLFISKKVRWTFSGYAMSQMKRIRTHRSYLLNPPQRKPERSDFGLDDTKLVTDDQMGAIKTLIIRYKDKLDKEGYSEIVNIFREEIDRQKTAEDFAKEHGYEQTEAHVSLINNQAGANEEAVIEMDEINIHHLGKLLKIFQTVLTKEYQFQKELEHYNQYNNWKKNRNATRAELEEKYSFDTKHASHLYRIYMAGEELLKTGNFTVYNEGEKGEFLRAIRKGAVKYEELETFVQKMDIEVFPKLYETSLLPMRVDGAKVDELLLEILDRVLFKKKIIITPLEFTDYEEEHF